MKFFWIFIFNIVFSLLNNYKLNAQTDTLYLYQIYQSFSNEEKAEWTAFKNNWNYFHFSKIKSAFKLKTLNCKSCKSLYADVFIDINKEGEISSTKFLNGKKCGAFCEEETFVSLFENSLKLQKFNSIKNRRFIVRFGYILKC